MYRCPRDRHELVKHPDKRQRVWRCNVCSGGFVRGIIRKTVTNKGAAFPREEWDIPVRCPGHRGQMTAFRHKGVQLDYCGTCRGVWMDGCEIAKVLGPKFAEPTKQKRTSAVRQGGTDHDWLGGADILGPFIEGALSAALSP
jgi:Zn-finger nucleic acid-binding protein